MKPILVITGGSRGIGLATAACFADQGYQVINISRSPAALEGVVNLAVDLSLPDWPDRHGSQVLEAVTGREVVLIHNAGVTLGDSVPELDALTLRRVLQVNLVAPAQLNRLLIPTMAQGSSILYVGSTLGEKAVAGSCSYVVSKHALIGLMRATCQDLAGTGIHTACVCPGFTDTEMLREHAGSTPGTIKSIEAAVTFKRLIEPDEIARTLLFFARNPVINGAVIHANLGQVEH